MIYEMARSGKLNQAEMAKIAVTYKQWENHPLHGSSLQDKHRVMLDPMYQHAMDGRHGSQYTDADDPAKPFEYRYEQITDPGFQASPPRSASGRLRDEFDRL